MGFLDATDLATLRTELAGAQYANLSDLARFNALHQKALIANPQAQANVPKPYAMSDVMGLLSPASIGGLKACGYLATILADVNANNRQACMLWVTHLLDGALVTQAEHDNLVTLFQATIPDPSWQAQIAAGQTRKQALFGAKIWTKPDGSSVDYIPLDDVAAARS